MNRDNRLTRSAALSAILIAALFNTACGEEKKPNRQPQKISAEQFIADAERALATIGKALKESTDNSLDPKNLKQQPFWSAVKRTSETVRVMKSQLKARDPKFFETINDGTQDSALLRGVYPRSGIKNSVVEEAVKALSNALTVLRKNYGREARRKQKGGEINDAEKAEFAKLKEAQKTLVGTLKELEIQVHANKHLSAELTHVLSQLQTGIDAPVTLESLHRAREIIDVIEGEWNAYSYYVEPKYRKAWQDSKAIESLESLEDLAGDAEEITLEDWTPIEVKKEPAEKILAPVTQPDELAEYEKFFEQMTPVELEAYYAEVMTEETELEPIEELD